MDGGTGFHDVDELAPDDGISRARWNADMAEVIGALRFGMERRPQETLTLACDLIEANADPFPHLKSSLLGGMREAATDWAETASPAEIEAITAAGFKAIGRNAFALSARKRLMVMLWNSLAPEDRAAFLDKMGRA